MKIVNQQFLDSLEIAISRALWQAKDRSWRAYWCDGILEPENNELVTDATGVKGILTIAILPKGQYDEAEYRFSLYIWLGVNSERCYNNGKTLETCIPDNDTEGWIYLDIPGRRMEVELW